MKCSLAPLLSNSRSFLLFSRPWSLGCLVQVLHYFTLTGYCVTKPEVIFRLEQGEEPWILEKEFPSHSFPGELMCTAQMNIRGFIIFLWLIHRLTTLKCFLKNISFEVQPLDVIENNDYWSRFPDIIPTKDVLLFNSLFEHLLFLHLPTVHSLFFLSLLLFILIIVCFQHTLFQIIVIYLSNKRKGRNRK